MLLRRSRIGLKRFSARVAGVRVYAREGEGGARGPRMGLGLGRRVRVRKRWEGALRGGGGKCRIGERGVGGSVSEGGERGRAVRGALAGMEKVGQAFIFEAELKGLRRRWDVARRWERLRVGVEGSVLESEEEESEL